MSTTIDSKVVEMRFDNKQFESGVSTTMSTLDKLKQKLGFEGASKGLDNLSASAKKVDMSSLGNSVEKVGLQFDALQVMGVTALTNLTNSAVNAGKKILNALFVEPVKAGFSEYELKLDSIKTIMASTGESVETVNKYLEELNAYSDQTIYSFSDMTQNIGKFTNAGVKLEDAVLAIKGISNEAAVSGANANEASRAMYNFAQALSAGHVKLIDWKSIENANMATVEFKQQLIDTAVELGTVTQAADGMYQTLDGTTFNAVQNFNDTLQDQWMTTDVLVGTLRDYADETTDIGKKAFAAAQDVTKLTQMFDVLKETAQSGWAKTWEILLGDIEQAKAIFTPLTNFFSGIINSISDFRNKILESALAKTFEAMLEPLKKGLGAIETIKAELVDYGKLVDEIILGKWGNEQKRWDALTAAGYDWAHAQNLVNIRLNDPTRHATNFKEAQKGANDAMAEGVDVNRKLNNAEKSRLVQLSLLTDEQLKAKGYTDEFISALRDLQDVADKTGIPLRKFLDHIDEINGRWLIVEGFKNIGKTLTDIFGALGKAFKDAFGGLQDGIANGILNATMAFHKFTTKLLLNKETVDKLTRTFKGLFAIIDIIATIMGSAFKVAFKVIQEVAKAFGYLDFGGLLDGVLSVTAAIGDVIASFRDWLEEHNLIYRAIEILVPMVINFGRAIEEMVRWFLQLPAVQFTIERISRAFEVFGELFGTIGSIIYDVADSLAELKTVKFSDIAHSISVGWGRVQTAFNDWLNSHPKVKAAFDVIKDACIALGNSLKTAFDEWLAKHPQLQASVQKLKDIFGSLFPEISGSLGRIGNLISDTVMEFLNLESYDFSDVKNVFKTIFSGIGAEIDNFISKFPELQKFVNSIKNAFARFKSTMQNLGIFDPFRRFFESLKNMDTISFDGIKNALKSLAIDIYQTFTGAEDIPEDFVDGLVLGLKGAASKILAAMGQLGRDLLAAIKEVLGIHSPSTEAEAIGGHFIQGLVNGLQNGLGAVLDVVKGLATRVIDFFKSFNWGGIIAGVVAVGLTYATKKLADVVGAFASPLSGIGSIFDGTGKILEGVGVTILKSSRQIKRVIQQTANLLRGFRKAITRMSRGISFKMIAAGIKDIAIGIGILVASVVLLTLIDSSKLWQAVGIMGVLVGMLAVLVGVVAGLSALSSKVDIGGIGVAKIALTIVGISLAMVLMAAAVKKIANVDADGLKRALAAMLIISGMMVIVMMGFGAAVNAANAVAFAKLGGVLLAMATSMLLLATVAKMMSKMTPEQFETAAAGMTALLGVMALMMLISKMNVPGAGGTFLALAGTMAILVIVAKLIAGMEWGEMGKAAAGLLGLVGVMALMMLVTKLGNTKKVGVMLIQLAGAMAILAIVMKLLGSMEWGELLRAELGMVGLVGVMALMMLVTRLGNTKKVGVMLMQLAGTMAILAIVMKILGSMSWGELARATVGIALLGGVVAGLVAVTRLAPTGKMAKVGGTLLIMSISIAILAGIAMLLSLVDIANLAKGIIAVGLLAGIVSAMVVATKFAGSYDLKGTMLGMAVAIGVMAAAIAILSFIEPSKLIAPTIAMGLLMGMFAVMLNASKGIKTSIATLAIMVGAIAIIALAIGLLAQLPVEDVMGTAIALSAVMLAMAAALNIVGKFGKKNVKNALIGVALLTAMVVPLLAFGFALSAIPDLSGSTHSIIALVAVVTAMSLLLIPLTIIGASGTSAIIGVGILTTMVVPLLAFIGVLALLKNIQVAANNVTALIALATAMTLLLIPLTAIGLLGWAGLIGVGVLTAMAVPLLAFVGVLALMNNIENAEQNARLLIRLMITMTAILLAVSYVAPLAVVGVGALTALTGLMVGLGVLAVAVGALMEKFPALKTFLDTGIDTLVQLAEGLGRIIGAFVVGFAGEVLQILPMVGQALSDFMANAQPFIDSVKTVDTSVLEGVGILSAAIIALTAADLIAGVSSFLQGGSSFATLGTELSTFMTNAQPFINAAKSIDPSIIDSVKTLAETVLILTGANLLENLTSWLGGEASLATFGNELAAFGPSLQAYSNAVTGIDNEAVLASSQAAKNLAEMAATLPNEGGLLGFFAGENDMATFGSQLVSFGSSLKLYSLNVAGLDVEAVDVSVAATKSLAEMAGCIENVGGVVAWFMGDNDLATFGTQLLAYGIALKQYGGSVAGLDTASIDTSVTATNSLSNMSSSIENIGGLVAWFTGDNDLATFGQNLVKYGASLMKYADTVAGIDTSAISDSVIATRALANVAKAIPESGGIFSVFSGNSDMSTFGKELKKFGKAIVEYSETVSGIDSEALSSSTAEFKKLADLAKKLEGVESGTISSFSKSLGDISTDGVDKFVNAFNNGGTEAVAAVRSMLTKVVASINSKQSAFSDAGKKLATKFVEGYTNNSKKISTAANSSISSAVSSIRSKYTQFYNAGKYLVQGFCDGITANTWRAEAKAKAMANAAEIAAKAELRINSPSKVFMAIGAGVPEGFAKGIDKLGGLVVGSTKSMASTAINSTKKAMNRIADAINADIDTQPTIRPVLDLSDVTAGAGMIGNLLNTNPTVGVMANVNAINSSMNRRGQNGINGDVVSAIRDLKDSLGNRGDTYQINGITYDNGSAISEAIGTLVRATLIEGRA